MNIGIQTWGSEGDILPFLALAEGLQNAGHVVTVAYTSVDNKSYSCYETKGGFTTYKVFENFDIDMDEAMAEIVETNDPLKQFVLVMERYFDPAVQDMYKASTKLCAENDIVIGHMMTHTLLTAAEKFNRPRVVLALSPLAIRTNYIPLFGPNLGFFFNQLTWRLGDYVGRKKLFSLANKIRTNEALPPIKSLQDELYVSKNLTLIASSPSFSLRRDDWDDSIQISGELDFRSSNQQTCLPDDLKTFLASGSAPVYMTFGSISPYQAEKTAQLMLDAVKEVGCRAIIQADWNNIHTDSEPEGIFKCQRLPHAEIFPLCAAIVHHGGAGTTHSALRAGCPSIVVEHAFDQTFWGNELERVGAAGKVLHRNSLTASGLAGAIRRTLNAPQMRQHAMIVSKKMQTENGVQNAVNLIEEKFSSYRKK